MSNVADKPKIQLEPTFSHTEIAKATGFSISHVQKEAAAGHLRCRREGRRMVATQRDIDAWQAALYEREEDRRAARVTRRDQQNKPSAKAKGRKPNTYSVQADSDIKTALGLDTASK